MEEHSYECSLGNIHIPVKVAEEKASLNTSVNGGEGGRGVMYFPFSCWLFLAFLYFIYLFIVKCKMGQKSENIIPEELSYLLGL